MKAFRIVFKMPFERGTPRWVKKSYTHISQAETEVDAVREAVLASPEGWYISKAHLISGYPPKITAIQNAIIDSANEAIVAGRK